MAEPARKPDNERPWLRPVGEDERAMEPVGAPPTSGLAIAGLILSIVSLFVFGLILAPIGALFAAVGLVRINKGERAGRGLAWAGIIVGGLSFGLLILFLVLAAPGGALGPGVENGTLGTFGLF